MQAFFYTIIFVTYYYDLVRWAYTAKNNGELSVRERDEVEILKREHNNMYLVCLAVVLISISIFC